MYRCEGRRQIWLWEYTLQEDDDRDLWLVSCDEIKVSECVSTMRCRVRRCNCD